MENTITIAQTGEVKEVAFKTGMTVGEALAAGSITIGRGRTVRVNGRTVDNSYELASNDTILIVGNVRGA